MKHTWDVKLTIGLATIIFLLLAIIKGEAFAKELFGIISQTISYTFLVRLVFIKWIWKWLPFLEFIHGTPKIEGKWAGTFESTWRPSPDAPPATGPIEVKITQPDIYHIKLTQKSGESLSHSYGEVFETLEDGSIFLNFSYKNVPNADVRDRSQISFGSARYQLERDGSYKLSGNYWTDRKSTGKITVVKS
ncbi:MAG: hypothetical protein ACLGGX_10930 [Bdellovibrionia bacterium]